MAKRKATTSSKPARSPRAAKAQRTNAVIRSPKPRRLSTVAADPIESNAQDHDDPKQEASIVERPATALQESLRPTMEPKLEKGFDFFSATATARAYQAKLLEVAQANMQFAFEFSERLAAIRSPVELPRVLEELTNKRIALFRKHSNELIELSMKR
jgi:hypothetical protein